MHISVFFTSFFYFARSATIIEIAPKTGLNGIKNAKISF